MLFIGNFYVRSSINIIPRLIKQQGKLQHLKYRTKTAQE